MVVASVVPGVELDLLITSENFMLCLLLPIKGPWSLSNHSSSSFVKYFIYLVLLGPGCGTRALLLRCVDFPVGAHGLQSVCAQ